KYLITGLPVISVAASVIFSGKIFPWGGAAGDMIKDWMYNKVGMPGTIGVLAVAVLSYIIWRFNPVFKLPVKNYTVAEETDNSGTNIENNNSEKLNFAVNETTVNKINTLKGNDKMLSIPDQDDHVLSHDIGLV